MSEKILTLSQIFDDDEISVILYSIIYYQELIKRAESNGFSSDVISIIFHKEQKYLDSILDDFQKALIIKRSD